MRMWLGIGWGAVGVYFSLAAGLDAYGARPQVDPVAVIVVAGAGVMPGGVPSDALWARTRAAVDLHEAGVAPVLAMTGGIGDWGPAESEVARRLAEGWGVDPAAILVEALSTSTEENARHARALLGDQPILVVTDRYHVFRCERVFRRHFTDVRAVGCVSPPWVRFRGALREVLAVAWYTVAGRL